MIFQHTIDKVLSGEKTQTRRLFKAGDYGWMCGYSNEINPSTGRTGFIYSSVSNQQSEKIINRWQVGKTYAIQPGRSMKAVGRIEIVSIRCQDVRNISAKDAYAEGFAGKIDFLATWAGMHDKSLGLKIVDPAVAFFGGHYAVKGAIDFMGLDEALGAIAIRPAKRYQAWVLEFKLVKAS